MPLTNPNTMDSTEDSPPSIARSTSILSGFATERGLPENWLTRYGVTVCGPDGEKPGWIAIPYPHKTGIWGWRYRNPNPQGPKDRYWNPAGQSPHLYNPGHIGFHSEAVFICEGEFDTLVLLNLGFPAVGLPGVGSADRMFHSAWTHLFAGADIFIMMDGDQYGRDAAQKLRDGFDKRGLRATIIEVPDHHDINSWYNEDKEALIETVTKALQ